MIEVSSGPGSYVLETLAELWQWMWAALASAIYFRAHGKCTCECRIAACDYCVAECWGAA
jgi:hypothetical protein